MTVNTVEFDVHAADIQPGDHVKLMVNGTTQLKCVPLMVSTFTPMRIFTRPPCVLRPGPCPSLARTRFTP